MSDIKDQLLGTVSGDMDVFKKIASKIPGFKGYIERQTRRDADKLLRDTVALRFRELENRVSALQREFIGSGDIGWVDDLERAALRLRTFSDQIRTAPRGYSGLFDAVKINEEDLARLYEYDSAFLDSVDEVNRAIDNVQASVGTEGLPASIRHLDTVTGQCVEAYSRRQEVVAAG